MGAAGGRARRDCGGVRVRLHGWVDLHDADPNLDAVEVGQFVAALHRVDFAGSIGVDPWYTEPVGAARWAELVALEAYLGRPPRDLRTCHRDLWADNVRRARPGGLCVFDFDNAGLADPSQELAVVLVEYGAEPGRAGLIRAAYAEAGGPGRVEDPADFAMEPGHPSRPRAQRPRTADKERGAGTDDARMLRPPHSLLVGVRASAHDRA